MPFTVIPLTCQEKSTLSLSDAQEWGLEHTLRPRFGARLVQEGCHLHFLADRAGVTGTFSATVACHLEHRFPLLVRQLEQKLVTGELDPRRQQRVTLHDGVLTHWAVRATSISRFTRPRRPHRQPHSLHLKRLS